MRAQIMNDVDAKFHASWQSFIAKIAGVERSTGTVKYIGRSYGLDFKALDIGGVLNPNPTRLFMQEVIAAQSHE